MERFHGSLHKQLAGPVVATLGNFDGCHIGHQDIFRRIAKKKRELGGVGAAISFYPHPAVVLGKAERQPTLTSPAQKLHILGRFGIDLFYLIRFTKSFSSLGASEFIDRYLLDNLDVAYLFIGEDAGVGRHREGGATFIAEYLRAKGREAEALPFVSSNGEKISSSGVRRAIEGGDLATAETLLGRPYSIYARVGHGEKRGRTLGYKTANLILGNRMIPPPGVYATYAVSAGRILESVTNIGTKPTFGSYRLGVETHVIGREESLYGSHLELFFIERLREERRFPSPDALKAQIGRDVEEALLRLNGGARETIARWIGSHE